MKPLLQAIIVFSAISPRLGAIHAQEAVEAATAETPKTNAVASENTSRPKLTKDNLQATAMAGAFYNALRRASSYQGHLTITKTTAKDGKILRKKIIDWRSTWLGDGDGGVKKGVAQGKFTTIEGDGATARTTTENVIEAYDGKMKRGFDPSKDVWSEKEHPLGEPDLSTTLSLSIWGATLMSLITGDEFKILRIPDTEPELIILTNQENNFELNFEVATGNLRLWRINSSNGETTELRWAESELNSTISDKVFAWVPPANARQVPDRENKRKFDF